MVHNMLNKLTAKLSSFQSETSIHGCRKLCKETSYFKRFIWTFLCSLSAACCGYFCYETFHEFFVYPTKTVISNTQGGIKFPDVTICNYNGFDMAVLKSLNDIVTEENFNYSMPTDKIYASETFEKAILQTYEKYKIYFAKYVENDNFNMSTRKDIISLKGLFTKQYLPRFLSSKNVLAGGISDWQMLLWCKYGVHECMDLNVTTIHDSNFVKCLIVHAPKTKMTLLDEPQVGFQFVSLLGEALGKSIRHNKNYLFNKLPGLYEDVSESTEGVGLRVVIHPPETLPNTRAHGIDIPPGVMSFIKMEIVNTTYLDEPYGKCRKGRNYRKSECLSKCVDMEIHKECGCSWLNKTGNKDVPLCGLLPDSYPPDGCVWTDNQTVLEKQMKICLEPLIKSNKSTECQFVSFLRFIGCACDKKDCSPKFCATALETYGDSMETHCKCYKNCDKYTYKNDVSFTDWPRDIVKDQVYHEFLRGNEYFLDKLRNTSSYRRELLEGFYFNQTLKPEILKDLCRVSIYFKTTTVTHIEEQPVMKGYDLVSGIGGTLGLFVGMSILSMCEVVQLVCEVIAIVFCQRKQNKMNKVIHRIV